MQIDFDNEYFYFVVKYNNGQVNTYREKHPYSLTEEGLEKALGHINTLQNYHPKAVKIVKAILIEEQKES
jgi:predicted transcriptional regulator